MVLSRAQNHYHSGSRPLPASLLASGDKETMIINCLSHACTNGLDNSQIQSIKAVKFQTLWW